LFLVGCVLWVNLGQDYKGVQTVVDTYTEMAWCRQTYNSFLSSTHEWLYGHEKTCV